MPGGGPADKANFTALLSTCRSKLNAAGTADGKTYDLTMAQSAGKKHIDDVDWATINSNGSLSHVNLMTYDFHGAFDPKTGHQSPLYANPQDSFTAPVNTQFNVDWAFRYLTGSGGAPPEGTKSFPSNKVSIGMAFYTRGWSNVTGGIDVDGGGADGLFGTGRQRARRQLGTRRTERAQQDLTSSKPAAVGKKISDNAAKAHFLYSSSQQALYTYDTVEVGRGEDQLLQEQELRRHVQLGD